MKTVRGTKSPKAPSAHAQTSLSWPQAGKPGSAERPIGWDQGELAKGSYLVGVQCRCRCAFLTLSGYFDSTGPLRCPQCGTNVRSN